MRAVKIAPGKHAKYWKDCLANDHICVGWGEVGNLKDYSSEAELRDAVNRYQYDGKAPGRASSTAWQLWTLRHLQPGDKVIANRGKSVVLRVGTVTGNGREPYRYDADHRYEHIVPVDWGASTEPKKIRSQKEWSDTVVDVPAELYKLITGSLPADFGLDGSQDTAALKAVDALESAKEHGAGQGYSGSAEVRAALEKHAVRQAIEYFSRQGFRIVEKGKPYDLCCTRSRKQLFVEVKGTQGGWEKVILTRNEVKFARRTRKQMVLFVLHHINITGNPQKPRASGGTPHILRPWDLDAGKLDPPAYEYYLPH